jgi:hypothetical protein
MRLRDYLQPKTLDELEKKGRVSKWEDRQKFALNKEVQERRIKEAIEFDELNTLNRMKNESK